MFKDYLDEFFDYYSYSGKLTFDFKNKINYYFGVSFDYLEKENIPKKELKKIILEHHSQSELEKDLEDETNSLLNGNF